MQVFEIGLTGHFSFVNDDLNFVVLYWIVALHCCTLLTRKNLFTTVRGKIYLFT